MESPLVGRGGRVPAGNGAGVARRDLLVLGALALATGATGLARAAGPQGQLAWGIHTTLAPTWFDPAETPGIITPFMVLYALHDALVKPMPVRLALIDSKSGCDRCSQPMSAIAASRRTTRDVTSPAECGSLGLPRPRGPP